MAVLVQAVELEDERLTYVEGALRRSIGPPWSNVSVARDTKGGTAGPGAGADPIGGVSLSAEAIAANNFRVEGMERKWSAKPAFRRRADQARPGGIPAHADVRYEEGATALASLRLRADCPVISIVSTCPETFITGSQL